MTDGTRAALDALSKAAQVLAVGTGESQLHAATEHVAAALGASSVSLLALLSDPDHVYLVADSEEVDVGRGRLELDRYPHLRRALETGEVTSVVPEGIDTGTAEITAVFPVTAGRKAAGAIVARFSGEGAAVQAEEAAGLGRMAAALFGVVLRGARALEPIRERTRRVTLHDMREERRGRAIERYRAFIDSASDGIVVLDAAGAVLYMNRAAEEITGYARDGLAGRLLADFVPEAFRPLLETSHPPRRRQSADRQFRSGDRHHLRRSHHRFGGVDRHPLGARSSHLRFSRRYLGARSRTRAAAHERVLEADFEFDRRRHHRREHAGAGAGLQSRRRANLRLPGGGRGGADLVQQLYPPGVAQEVMRLIRSAEHGGGGRLEPVRRHLVSATGEQIPVSISAALVLDDDGREIATVGIFSDLRERLHMEERLASAQEKLEVSEKQAVAVELAGAAAHELNQPLTSVMGYAQVLIRKLGPADPRLPMAQTILDEADRMAAIVRKLGSLTRYETKTYVGGAQIIDLDRSTQEPFSTTAEPGKRGADET